MFLQGNNLAHNWQDTDRFVIGELGFGTGLNFLAAWKLFEETTTPSHSLDFVSFEKYPLTPEKIADYLQPWQEILGGRLQTLMAQYPPIIPGFHRLLLTDRITLTLI
ncbi:MAG: hypothetical protein V7701_17855, partial [Sneathiella sp.]